MVQMRRLDPLANAGPYQRLLAAPVKSVSLSEAQFERVRAERPELLLIDGDSAVVGRPHRDLLEIHYGFPDLEFFRAMFATGFERVVGASSKEEAPRGLLLRFRDRPNRMAAETIFWPLALDQGDQWVEWNFVAVPEQPPPEDALGESHSVREFSDGDLETLARLDGEVFGLPPLTDRGARSVVGDSKALRLVVNKATGAAEGYIALRGEPGGWGIIETIALKPEAAAVRNDALRWSIAWLRNNGGRRIRHRIVIDDSATIALLREAGFTPGETGLDFTRTVDISEAKQKIEERRDHGTLIKFGDWR